MFTFSMLKKQKNSSGITEDNFESLAAKVQLTDLDGNPVSLEQFYGKVVVANSWASWCPFCATELPALDAIAANYNEQDVVVLAINRAESIVQIKNYMQSIKQIDNIIILLDPQDTFYNSIEGYTMPETVFYDDAGNSMFHKRGVMQPTEISSHINSARAELK